MLDVIFLVLECVLAAHHLLQQGTSSTSDEYAFDIYTKSNAPRYCHATKTWARMTPTLIALPLYKFLLVSAPPYRFRVSLKSNIDPIRCFGKLVSVRFKYTSMFVRVYHQVYNNIPSEYQEREKALPTTQHHLKSNHFPPPFSCRIWPVQCYYLVVLIGRMSPTIDPFRFWTSQE
jgi:hypothetical protein